MKRFIVAAAVAALLLAGHAGAQFAEAQPSATAPPNLLVTTNLPGTVAAPGAKPDGPLGALAVAPPPAQSGGIISLGPIFGNPQIDQAAQDLVNGLILAAMSWLFWLLKNKFNIDVDQGHRDAYTAAAQRQASSLVADGMVSLSGKTINVNDKAMYQAVHALQMAVPGALKNFGITDPEKIADRIKDMIPQVPAIAPAVAAAHATNGNGNGIATLPPQPPQEKPS
jgi:hypothetical protein